MGWSFGGQWRREWTCGSCNCKGNSYNRATCRRCHTSWWEGVPRDAKKENPSKWANGMPQWLRPKVQKEPKEPKTPTEESPKETQLELQISSIQSCLEVLGEEEEDTRAALQTKLEVLKAQQPEEPEDSVRAREVSELKKRQVALEKALVPLKGVPGCEEEVTQMETRLEGIRASIKEKTKKPAEDRMRSLQDKKAHKVKSLMALDTEIEQAEKTLSDLREKEREMSKELKVLGKELTSVMKELDLKEDSEDEATEMDGGREARALNQPPNGGEEPPNGGAMQVDGTGPPNGGPPIAMETPPQVANAALQSGTGKVPLGTPGIQLLSTHGQDGEPKEEEEIPGGEKAKVPKTRAAPY